VPTVGEIVATAVRAVPSQAESITSETIMALPEYADEIRSAAIVAAPQQAASITMVADAAERQAGSLALPGFETRRSAFDSRRGVVPHPWFEQGYDPAFRQRDPVLTQ
jgi:hypothetical protein